MARKRARAKMNIPMCLAGVLFCLTLFSFHLSSGVIARYSATTDGADSARVIEFGKITLTKTGADDLIVYPGAELSWNAAVSFGGSESATYVFLEVKPKGDSGWQVSEKNYTALYHGDSAPGLTWTVDDDWDNLDGYPNVFFLSLEPNATLENVPVIKDGSITVAKTLEAEDLEDMSADFGLDFAASVVQSNGFDGPEAAWKSLEVKNQA